MALNLKSHSIESQHLNAAKFLRRIYSRGGFGLLLWWWWENQRGADLSICSDFETACKNRKPSLKVQNAKSPVRLQCTEHLMMILGRSKGGGRPDSF